MVISYYKHNICKAYLILYSYIILTVLLTKKKTLHFTLDSEKQEYNILIHKTLKNFVSKPSIYPIFVQTERYEI